VVDQSQIRAAEVVLPCADLDGTLAFFTERLGFRLERIWPADDPAVAVIAGHGVRLRLDRGAGGSAGAIHLDIEDHDAVDETDGGLRAPNGTTITVGPVAAQPDTPPLRPSFVLSRAADATGWVGGRAGMQYRDLIPDRQGGRFIASHIRIPGGGPVADYVHHHRVRFQMIFCLRGAVRVVYEDQGPPFTLEPGDCVLQPPEIRHRVLESAGGLEVIELTCPAQHETLVDHDLTLPNGEHRPRRTFGGQRFVRHVAARARWSRDHPSGWAARDLGLGAATGGLTDARVVRLAAPGAYPNPGPVPVAEMRPRTVPTHTELAFTFVIAGTAVLSTRRHGDHPIGPGDAFVVPAGDTYTLGGTSPDVELLEVRLPA
jgi:mannose-6-phosphate isomerase-like protein (cupin superfamily)